MTLNTSRGFSLTEVLISLLLFTTISLLLLTQQWKVNRLFNQTYTRMLELTQIDNTFERLLTE